MLQLKHLSLKEEEGDAEGEAPQSKKKRVMLRAKHVSKKSWMMLQVSTSV